MVQILVGFLSKFVLVGSSNLSQLPHMVSLSQGNLGWWCTSGLNNTSILVTYLPDTVKS